MAGEYIYLSDTKNPTNYAFTPQYPTIKKSSRFWQHLELHLYNDLTYQRDGSIENFLSL